MFDVVSARVLEPLDRELFELVFGDHGKSSRGPLGSYDAVNYRSLKI